MPNDLRPHASLLIIWVVCLAVALPTEAEPMSEQPKVSKLPAARTDGSVSVETALDERRSVRRFSDDALSLSQVTQLLWAAQGRTDRRGFRTAPSAGATYPLELLVAAGRVEDLAPGIYRYRPAGHDLVLVAAGDRRQKLFDAALGQHAVAAAPAVFIFFAVYERTLARYGERGIRYVHMEAGHAAQNLLLQAVSLDLSAVVIGAFHDHKVQQVLTISEDEHPLYLVPVGR